MWSYHLPAPPPFAWPAGRRFIQRPNCVEVEEGEAALRGAGRYSELVALYQVGPGAHRGLNVVWQGVGP